MSFYYLDANAIAKQYILEPASTWMRSLIEAVDDRGQLLHAILMADISTTEVASALAIVYRTGRITKPMWDRAFDWFMDDVERRYQFVPTQRDDFTAAAFMIRRFPLKAYDAVQLAVALRYHQVLVANQLTFTFISGDRSLLGAAEAEGLATDNPFAHILPEDTPQN